MALGYLHFETITVQSAKRGQPVCGDVVQVQRTVDSTILVCADGMGSGLKAHIAATMCASRLLTLLQGDYSLREAFANVADTMNKAREPGLPYAAFAVARFLSNGQTAVLCYDSPPPILVTTLDAAPLRQQSFEQEGAVISECTYRLRPDEAILLITDGITNAGLGASWPEGWGVEGACRAVRNGLSAGSDAQGVTKRVHDRARQHWGTLAGDDCTAVMVRCRKGNIVNIFTGPPSNRAHDTALVERFLATEGFHVVAGGTTAQIVSRYLDDELQISELSQSCIAPPFYNLLEGVDLITEGVVTLNQVFNVLEASPDTYEPNSSVTQFCELLQTADRVNFLVGQARNLANEHISFRQKGIHSRNTVVPMLAQKLKAQGKLVAIEYF